MNKWKIAFFITLTALIVLSGLFIYKSIDRGYTKAYRNDACNDTESDFVVLREIFRTKNLNRDSIKAIIKQTNAHSVTTEQNDIYLNRVELLFDKRGNLDSLKAIY